jgi:hypothetical protein
MSVNGGYPTQARVAIYDFNQLAVCVYWFDTYLQALTFTKAISGGVVAGTIDIVEVSA